MANRTYTFEFTEEAVDIDSSDGQVALNDMAHILAWSAMELSATGATSKAVMEISALALDILEDEDGQE